MLISFKIKIKQEHVFLKFLILKLVIFALKVEIKSTMYVNFTIFAGNFIQKEMDTLNSLHNIPINSAVLKAFLSKLKYPKNKISDMERGGELIRLKKDLYVNSKSSISKELLANHLYGVSYVSLETALAYYGMIPDRVYAIRSMTIKRAKTFSTPLGNFEYKTVPTNYFGIGQKIEYVQLNI